MLKSFIPALVVLAALVAACTSTGSTPAPTVAPPVVTPAPASAAPSVAAGPTVSVSSAGFFVGPNGNTLYTFDKDTASTSNCQTGQCVQNWPALTAANGTISLGTGLTASDFSTITRTDGSAQVTFKTIPLYFFAGDSAPGDKNGDGVGGIWHIATAASTLPAASSAPASVPAASAPAASSGGGSSVCYNSKYQVVPCPSTGAAGSPAAAGPDVTVSAAGYLVGPNGHTLYVFANDKAADSSACTGDCLSNWPPLTVASGATTSIGSGLDQEDFKTFTRSDDSSTQVEYYGKPLYYYGGDTAPGDTNGNGLFNLWAEAMPQ